MLKWNSNQIIKWKQTYNLCLVKITISDSKRKIQNWIGIRNPDLHISRLALYQLNYSGSIASTSLNVSLKTQMPPSRPYDRWYRTICKFYLEISSNCVSREMFKLALAIEPLRLNCIILMVLYMYIIIIIHNSHFARIS